MSGKVPKSIGFTEENLEWMDEHIRNRSAFINDLVEQYRTGNGRMEETIRNYRIQELQVDIEAERTKLESKEQRLETLREEQQQESHQKTVDLAEAREALEDTPTDATNPAVKNWAQDLGMTPVELVDELEENND